MISTRFTTPKMCLPWSLSSVTLLRRMPMGRMLKVLFSAGILLAGTLPAQTSDAKLLERAREIHKRIIAFDSHTDITLDFEGGAVDGKSQLDLPKAARGGLKGAAIALFVQQAARTPEGFAKARAEADRKYELITAIAAQNPEKAAIAYSPADVKRIAGQGKFAIVISMLNAYPMGQDISQIDAWYEKG